MIPKPSETVKVEFQPFGNRIAVQTGTRLSDAAQQAGIPLASDCGGTGGCGRCRVKVLSGIIPGPDPSEKSILEAHNARWDERLACRVELFENLSVWVPQTSNTGAPVIEIGGQVRAYANDNVVTSVSVVIPQPTLEDQRSSLSRVTDEIAGTLEGVEKISLDFLRRLSCLDRTKDNRVTIYCQDGNPVQIVLGQKHALGIAVDIGTTTIAGALWDLDSGKKVSSKGLMNPQVFAGEDVISRMNYALHTEKGMDKLSSLLRDALNRLTLDLCDAANVLPEQVVEISICANSAISHLFLNLPVEALARSPYVAGFSIPLVFNGSVLGLTAIPWCRVYLFPCIQSFVGGDHVAMISAADIDQTRDTVIGLDIGTNTEIVLAKSGELFVTSCASGPALEGAHIRDGMRAAPGAIEKVEINGGSLCVKTVQDLPPAGICGSGLVDAVAGLLKNRILDRRGHFRPGAKGMDQDSEPPAYIMAPRTKSATGRDILLTQKDISQLQLAKSAIYAGIVTLLKNTGTEPGEIAKVYLAGAFGAHLDTHNATAIGLMPAFSNAEFVQLGNAALQGASLSLFSLSERKRAAAIAQKARHMELASDPDFNRLYIKSMWF